MNALPELTRTTVDFLRHGAAQGGDCFRGHTDDPLTELGWQQMFQQCLGEQWQGVVSSPLRRCQSFASAWAQEQHTDLIVLPAWREIGFGDWEGRSADDISFAQSEELKNYYADPMSYTPPNAESYADFCLRIQQAWESLLNDYCGKKLLVVTHGGVIRALFSILLGMQPRQSFQIEVPHACLSRFSCFDDPAGRFVQLNFHRPV